MSNSPWLRVRSGRSRAASSGRSLRPPDADPDVGARWDAATPVMRAMRAMRVPDAAAVSAA